MMRLVVVRDLKITRFFRAVILSFSILFGGCSLAPKALDIEQQTLSIEGVHYEPPFEERTLPELSPEPDWKEVLHRAFLANRELEASYFNWKAAIEQVDIAASYPNTYLTIACHTPPTALSHASEKSLPSIPME